jgi:ribonuclease D
MIVFFVYQQALICLLSVLQVLGREERSLANLLRRYCSVTQDKTHQTADWRLRPLPRELQQYARGDVHWLPYLAGRLVAELQARSPSTSGVSCYMMFCYV